MPIISSRSAQAMELSRAAGELMLLPASAAALALAPRGDGHAVLVIPGWRTNDVSTAVLRSYLSLMGHSVHGWGLGINNGASRSTVVRLQRRLASLAYESGSAVSLVGWSLGGLLAYAAERQEPDLVRRVITLGSPLAGARCTASSATSLYSRADAIVDWRSSRIAVDSTHENIEVWGSHLGLGQNPSVLFAVADRLHQPDGIQAPFNPNRVLRGFFPPPKPPPVSRSVR
jgi:pimeloyl-ACP methyl ester carboxylesterase